MCGRFALFADLDDLADWFDFDPATLQDAYRPRWNIAPTTSILAIHQLANPTPNPQSLAQSAITTTRILAANQPPTAHPNPQSLAKNAATLMRWGIPSQTNNQPVSQLISKPAENPPKTARPLFNARAETVHRLPAFRDAFKARRCLIPVSGFYEWRKDASGRAHPVWFTRKDGAGMSLAALWTTEPAPNGSDGIAYCAIITCAANSAMSPIHHRMPVILPPQTRRQWLDAGANPADLSDLLRPQEWQGITSHPVSPAVNRAANDHPSLIERISQPIQLAFPPC